MPGFEGFTQEDVDIVKTMVRFQRIQAEEERIRIEMRRVKLEVNGCKKSVEKLLEKMNFKMSPTSMKTSSKEVI